MSSTPEVVTKKRGRPKKVVAAPEIESAAAKEPAAKKSSVATSKSTTSATSTSKKSTSTTSRAPRKSPPKTDSASASKIKTATLPPIDQKSAVKKGSPTRRTKTSTLSLDPAQEATNPLFAPSKTLDDNNKAKSEPVDVKSRPRASASNPPAEQFVESRTVSAGSISHSESTELSEKQKANGKRQSEARNTVHPAGEIFESLAKSAGGKETIERAKAAEQTQKLQATPANYVDAAAVQDSKILNALAASNKSAGTATSLENKIQKTSGSIEPSPVAAITDMPAPVRKRTPQLGSRQPPSHPPPIKPPLKQAAPREAQQLRPQRQEQAPAIKPQDVRNTKQYKSLARRWTSAMVALPILLYTSYALYERVFADKTPRSLPGTNIFPPVNGSSNSPSPSSSSPSTSTSTPTTTTKQSSSTD